MTPERLEFIKNLVTDTRHKRIIDELLTEIERLQEELRISKLPDDQWLEEYHKRRKAAKGEK